MCYEPSSYNDMGDMVVQATRVTQVKRLMFDSDVRCNTEL